MPNIEIKAHCPDLTRARAIAERAATERLGTIRQIDTYFKTQAGRLKLREITGPDQIAWLIPYCKSYEKAPARSDYQLLEAKDPAATKALLAHNLGLDFVVDKTREVFLIGNVRVHLDQVDGLGTFLEFEAVFETDTPEVRAAEKRKVEELMRTFGLCEGDLLTRGYVDLLKANVSRDT